MRCSQNELFLLRSSDRVSACKVFIEQNTFEPKVKAYIRFTCLWKLLNARNAEKW